MWMCIHQHGPLTRPSQTKKQPAREQAHLHCRSPPPPHTLAPQGTTPHCNSPHHAPQTHMAFSHLSTHLHSSPAGWGANTQQAMGPGGEVGEWLSLWPLADYVKAAFLGCSHATRAGAPGCLLRSASSSSSILAPLAHATQSHAATAQTHCHCHLRWWCMDRSPSLLSHRSEKAHHSGSQP